MLHLLSYSAEAPLVATLLPHDLYFDHKVYIPHPIMLHHASQCQHNEHDPSFIILRVYIRCSRHANYMTK